MSKENNISRLAIKAMGLFGGVQVMGIICSIVRTKLVAMWIGPVGVGLFGLFNNALEMLNTGTNLGIRGSSVRDISQAMSGDDRSLIARIIVVVRRWSLWLGLGGALLTLLLSPVLSQVTFGTQDHMWGFVALSVAVLLMAISNGEQAVLQGTRRLKRLARASVTGTLLGLLISIPLFYWLRERSVLPSIIAYAVCNGLAFWLLRSRDYPPTAVSRQETVTMGRDFVRLGFYMTVGNFVTILASYVFNAWLNHEAGTAVVGHYQAGYTLINKYTGLILSALGMEYYPRLAQVATERFRLRQTVSQEVTVAMLVLAPVVAVFVLLRAPIIQLLYSADFAVIAPMVSWGMAGTVMRALSWCMAFVILARGDGKTYVITESVSAVVGLGLNIMFYRWWGITGLGLAFMAWYVVYTVIIAAVYIKRYRLNLTWASVSNWLWALAVVMSVVVSVECHQTVLAVLAAIVSLTVSALQLVKQWRD
ncbi:MAG: oligosaccharide flippase family protein [Muribaculaceae bacterium]|nr:oligosaccharide flippase family protein [Muribaculaceae bacterium]